MDAPKDIREFLTTRRARLTPEQVGLPDFGGRRRVPGLRREEVALVAGMSVEYYTRLERGNAKGVSEAVLEGISRARRVVRNSRISFGVSMPPNLRQRPRPQGVPGVNRIGRVCLVSASRS